MVDEVNLPVQVSGYQGQLLNGKVQSIFFNGLNYQNLSWSLKPLGVFSGELAARLEMDDPRAEFGVDVWISGQQNWQFSDLNGRVALAPASNLSRMVALIKPEGDLVLNNLASSLNGTMFSDSEGTLEWQNASLTFNGQRLPLGLLSGQLSDDGEYLVLDFSGQESIQPIGQIKVTATGAYTAELTLNPEQLPARMSWLTTMGQMNPEGRLAISLKGNL